MQTVPQVPWSHTFVERLVGTIRREHLDHLVFWNAEDLERKLELFQSYYNGLRMHQWLDGETHDEKADSSGLQLARLERYAWGIPDGVSQYPRGQLVPRKITKM